MNRKPMPQLALFPDELPNWEALPEERQHELQEVLSRLLEQSLQQQTFQLTHDPQNQNMENQHV